MKTTKSIMKKWPQIKAFIQVTSWIVTIIAAASVFVVGVSVLKTQPDLRTSYFSAFLLENGHGSSEGEDSITMKYLHVENIEYLQIGTKIVNIGSGVAYDINVSFGLFGMKYSQAADGDWIKGYVSGREDFAYSGSLENPKFSFGRVILSQNGGNETFMLLIPFSGIGSIDNLPTSCILTVKDITETTLLEKTVTFSYIQSG
jgi:hypothetical protein